MATYDPKKRSTFQSEDLSLVVGPDTRKKQRKMKPGLNTGKFSSVQDVFPQFLYR